MKSMIAILALLGVATASLYGPEQQQYRHLYNEEPIHTPSFYKHGQTWPSTFQKTFPYGKYFNNYPHKSHFEYPSYEKDFVPEFPMKEMSLSKHLTIPTFMDKTFQHGYPYYYPYGQDKLYKPTERFVPFYEKYMPKYERFVPELEKFMPKYEQFIPQYEKFMPQYEKFMPKYEKFMPQYEKFMPKYEKFMPQYEKFMPQYEKFVPEYEKFMPKYEKFVPEYEKFMPKYEKFVPEYEKFMPRHEKFVPEFEKFVPRFEKHIVEPTMETEFKPTDKIVTKTLEGEKIVDTPIVHEEKIVKAVGEDKIHEKEFTYPKFEKFSPNWYKYYGYKNIPYQYETSEYYPKYNFEHRPYHYGLY